MSLSFHTTTEYKEWFKSIKGDINGRQIQAALKVNTDLLLMYWNLGQRIIEKQKQSAWGDALMPQLAKDLANAFPGSKGFSRSNLFYIRKWVEFYSDPQIVPQLVGQLQSIDDYNLKDVDHIVPQFLTQLPWGHNRVIIDKCKTPEEAIFYLRQSLANNWSRNVLSLHIQSNLYQRQGKSFQNFNHTLNKIQADLANDTLKNPYNFDFLTIGEKAREKDLENALVNHMQKFLLELGQGFAFIGKQYQLCVGGDDFYIDLLFYHLKLRCFIVVELKTTSFQPEYAGKLNFYLNVVDAVLRHSSDQQTMGILLCKTPNKVVVEYALKNIGSPLGISEYQLVGSVPENLRGDLPTIEDIEQEFQSPDL